MTEYSYLAPGSGGTVTLTAQKAVAESTLKFTVIKNDTVVRVNPNRITENSISLYTNSQGGTSGATGVNPPYTVTIQASEGSTEGPLFTVSVLSPITGE